MDDEILNIGLDLAMEWGEHWLKPIQDRLQQLHPELTREQLDEYDSACRGTMNFGHDLVRDLLGPEPDTMQIRPEWERRMRAVYPWISDANLGRNFSQGCYYAVK